MSKFQIVSSDVQNQIQYEAADVQTPLSTPCKSPCSAEGGNAEPFCPFVLPLSGGRFHLVALEQMAVRRAEAGKLLPSQSSGTWGTRGDVVAA